MTEERLGDRALRALLDLYSDPTKWTQGETARNRLGVPVGVGDISAACWCMSGALFRMLAGGAHAQDTYAARRRINALTDGDYVAWNDAPGRTIDDVRALIQRALDAP